MFQKIKLILALVLTLLIVATGAMLPGMASAAMDGVNAGQVDYAQAPTVSLSFSQRNSQPSGLSFLGKLAMMSSAKAFVEIPSDYAFLSESMALEAADAALQPYIDSGMIPPFSAQAEVSVHAWLKASDTKESFVVWNISKTDSQANQIVDLYLDDETGQILFLNFVYDEIHLGPAYCSRENFYRLAELFFQPLGLEYTLEEVGVTDGGVYMGNATFGDMEYGEVSLYLHIAPTGFYIG